MPPCAVKACAVRPVFAREQIQANVQGPMKQNPSRGEQSEAPRRRWKPGQQQHPGPENQDSQHMLNQPRGSFPEKTIISAGILMASNVRLRFWCTNSGGWPGSLRVTETCDMLESFSGSVA